MAQTRPGTDRVVLANAVRSCTARLDEIEATNRSLRLLLAGGSLGVVALAALFAWSLWNTLQRQLAPEKLETAVAAKLQAIGPPLGQKLADEVIGAVPTYSEMAVERGGKAWPGFAARIATEADTFAASAERMVRQRADEAVERVAARLASDLKRDFPKLTEDRCEFLAKRLRDGLIMEGAGLGEEVQATIGRERERLLILLDKLPVETAALEPEARLQKRFMRNVLQMADALVAEWPADDEPVPPVTESPRPQGVTFESVSETPAAVSAAGTEQNPEAKEPAVGEAVSSAATETPPATGDGGAAGASAE